MRMRDLERFVRSRKVSFLGSIDKDGAPNIKAMLSPRQIIGLKEYYFSTNLSSLRTQQFIENPKACLYFYHKGLVDYRGVMFRGIVEVITDQEMKNLLWKPSDVRFYELGVTDPDYCVLKFTAMSARYYRNLKSEEVNLVD